MRKYPSWTSRQLERRLREIGCELVGIWPTACVEQLRQGS
jgi:hypothetical protein